MKNKTTFNPRHILCPVDFSDLSILALKYAVSGARLYAAKLTILHSESLEVPRYFSRTEADRFGEELANAKKMITKELSYHVMKDLGRRADGLDIKYQVIDEPPVDSILKAAEDGQVDLIVMGTHGLSGFKRLLLGSTAENIVHNAGVPVFTVRQKQHEFIDVNDADASPHIERILCAAEVNEYDREMLGHAVSLAELFNAKLTVLYSDESYGDKVSARAAFCSWISGMAKTQCDLEPVVRSGGAADQIIMHAKEEKSDLIVIGAHHRMFHDSAVLGKTTELVVRHAPAPVLVFPSLPV
jgi:nucleotide-binding universal stress UspA family protein